MTVALPNHALSPIHLQIMWDRLIAVVEEQAQTLIRTGFSTSTREAGDVSAGVFDLEGSMLAQAVTGTPGHVNSMAKSVGHFLRRFPVSTMKPGDIFVTNDPWMGTGHLNDFTVLTPTFRNGRPVALFASTCHVVDIGGRGLVADAKQVYEEGLSIPLMRLADGGRMDETLLEILRVNVREPIQVVGDLYSLIASNDTGSRRLLSMMDEFGIEQLDSLGAEILVRSRQAAIEAIRAIAPGTYKYKMTVDGYDKPIDLVATMTVHEDGIEVDYAGTSDVSAFGINVPICYTEAYSAFGIKCLVYPKVPNNAGSLSVVRVTAPDGCILNAKHPSPVAIRHATGLMLPDVMFGCLHGATGGQAPAEGASNLWNLMLMGGPGRVAGDPALLRNATPFNIMSFHSGGMGARPGKDGLATTAFPSGVRNVAVEVTEAIAPVVFWRKEYRTDSGGAGKLRGGLGQTMEIGCVEDVPFGLSATFDRIQNPPRGRAGGKDGLPGSVGTAQGIVMNGKGHQSIPRGDRLIVEMPGGGGLGDPRTRAIDAVAADVKAGVVSVEAARADYAVVVASDGTVDAAATAELRRAQ
ncbi:MAG: hydantoinase B/oxoprolinase family protein [Alphaproteobacteria bacterium]